MSGARARETLPQCLSPISLPQLLTLTPSLPGPQDDELRTLLAKKPNVVAYDGFEPSGRMHIAQARAHCRALSAPFLAPPLTYAHTPCVFHRL